MTARIMLAAVAYAQATSDQAAARELQAAALAEARTVLIATGERGTAAGAQAISDALLLLEQMS